MSAASCKYRRCAMVVAIAACALASLQAPAQVTDTSELQAYLSAITRPNPAARANELRGFLQAWPQSSLRRDALEWLAWDGRLTDRSASVAYARELLALDPADPLATAVVMDNQPQLSGNKTYEAAQSAIQRLGAMRPPAGMGAAEFYRVRQFATAALCAAVGNFEIERKDFVTAREYLRRAATLAPDDARYAYSLGLADLSGKDPNASEGYLYLAHAVNLAQGSPAARQIDAYARTRYQAEGGKPGDWDRFLAAAVQPGEPRWKPEPAVAASAATPAETGSARAIAGPSSTAAPEPTGVATATPPKVAPPTPPLPKVSDLPLPRADEKELADLGLPGPDEAHRQPFRTGAPVSLGILVQSSLVNAYKREIVETLADMVRHLAANEQNEAFVLSFDKSIAFRQDLTGDTRALEHAIEKLKPSTGTALLDAITMAAFQLNRVSRAGNNRVLLVISDGGNVDSRMPPLMAMSQLESGAVRVDCIGLGVLDSEGERLLQSLSGRTGGEFRIADAAGIRGAAHEMAARFGVEFPE